MGGGKGSEGARYNLQCENRDEVERQTIQPNCNFSCKIRTEAALSPSRDLIENVLELDEVLNVRIVHLPSEANR